MALRRRPIQDATRVASWRELVHPQPEALLKRNRLQLWQYDHRKGAVLLLRPVQVGALPVLALVLETTKHHTLSALQQAAQAGKQPISDPVPKTLCKVRRKLLDGRGGLRAQGDGTQYLYDVEELVENGHAIRHMSQATFDEPAFFAIPVPEELWNNTRELPEAPGILQPMPPMTVRELRLKLKARGTVPRAAMPELASDRVAVVESKVRRGTATTQRGWDF